MKQITVMNDNFSHISVCADRVYELLEPALIYRNIAGNDAILLDATLGLGGHSEYFLQRLPELRVIGIDRDRQALHIAQERLKSFGDRIFFCHTRFDNIVQAYEQSPWKNVIPIRAILADFGISSLQLDNPDRGFSYAADTPLDMRMDQHNGISAAELLASLSKEEITRILRDYGQERFAASIAALIVRQRLVTPLERTGQLVDMIYQAIPAAARRKGGHPAKRTFQALRIAVNNELEAIEKILERGFNILSHGGRFVCLSFQSLEDILVKKYFAHLSSSRMPRGLPFDVPGHGPQGKLLIRGACKASKKEVSENPRAASVRVRAIEKLDDYSLPVENIGREA